MKNFIKIFSLIIAILTGLWSFFTLSSVCLYYYFYLNTDKSLENINKIPFDKQAVFNLIIGAVILLVISLIAAYIFWRLHKNKSKKENNTTLLDYNNTNE